MSKPTQKSCSSAVMPADVEPLLQLARFSWDWAPLLCDPAQGCRDYHRCWSSVRLLQKGGALPAGSAFFQDELASLVAADRRRILISGSADTGLMAMVFTICKAMGAAPKIVLVDQCRTTVTQNRILADYLGLQADIRQGDIKTLDCPPVDAVIVHSFLGFFPRPERQQVIGAWGRLLRPGGKVLMSATLAQSEDVPYPARNETAIDASKPRLVDSAIEAGMAVTEAEQLGEIAVTMLKKRLTHDPQLTRDFLDRAFAAAGIRLTAVNLKEKERLGPLAAFRLQSDLCQRGEIVGIRE